jgi:hydroxymethylglutaryl-CoA lyase
MDLPAHVRIREIDPRDGFQNEPELIQTEEKLRLIELLGLAAGPIRWEHA